MHPGAENSFCESSLVFSVPHSGSAENQRVGRGALTSEVVWRGVPSVQKTIIQNIQGALWSEVELEVRAEGSGDRNCLESAFC